jgi:hypothetical protein
MAYQVMSATQWARVFAKAYLENDFKTTLEIDPFAAVNQVRDSFGIDPHAKLMDIAYLAYSYPTGYPDSVATLLSAIFQGSTEEQLKEVFTSKTPFGREIALPSGEWIEPAGRITHLVPNRDAISLADWMRIYAFMWHQVRFRSNPGIKDEFEMDPAKALEDSIIPKLNAVPDAPPITYDYQKTPLFTVGAAPEDPETLKEITKDAKAKGYRFRGRMSC